MQAAGKGKYLLANPNNILLLPPGAVTETSAGDEKIPFRLAPIGLEPLATCLDPRT